MFSLCSTKESNPYTESTSSEHVSRVPHADSGSGFVGPFPSGFTPFFLMFGRQAKLPLDIIYGSTPTEPQPVHEYAKNLKRSLEDAYSRVREHLRLGIIPLRGRRRSTI
ncbi:hypothetical protein EMCRGX_G033460 [Ephydatia muelleri]